MQTTKKFQKYAIIDAEGAAVIKPDVQPKINPKNYMLMYIDPENGKKIVPFFQSYYPFSNFYPCKFVVAGQSFISAEQFFQFAKAADAKNSQATIAIMQSKDNNEILRIGNSMSGLDEESWESLSILAMVIALSRKFNQNPALNTMLLHTKDSELIEASPFDRKWGAGKSVQQILNGEVWDGKNFLGQCLSAIRNYSENPSKLNLEKLRLKKFPFSPIIYRSAYPHELMIAQNLCQEFGIPLN